MWARLTVVFLAGCAFVSDDHAAWRLDPDGDGVLLGDDCDDDDPDVGAATTWHADADADGFGDAASATTSCAAAGVADATDCDDTDAAVFPGAEESCNGVDDDCDGEADAGGRRRRRVG